MGDEIHALTNCCRSKLRRKTCQNKLYKIIKRANDEDSEPEELDSDMDMWRLMKRIQYLCVPRQRIAWGEVATLMAGIDLGIKKPKRTARRKAKENPDSTKTRRWFAQERTGKRGGQLLKKRKQ